MKDLLAKKNNLTYRDLVPYYAFNDYKNAIMLTDLSEIQSFLPAGHIDKLLLDTEYNFRLWKFKVTDDGK